jgi:RNA polymerase sigma-70 factor (ECF subfamily)
MNATSTINISEAYLVSGLLNNDQDYFSDIYDRYAAMIFGVILKWVKEEEKAEILLHNTFVKAWHSKNLFDAETENIYCWLCRLARICYNEY